MSKNFWGSTSNREPAPATSKEQQQEVQVALLIELGLLSNPDKKHRRTRDKDREVPGGGARVAGSHSKEGTLRVQSSFALYTSLHPSTSTIESWGDANFTLR